MSDAIILCPSCHRKLRMAESHQGQVVQCPLCQEVFRAPVGAPSPDLPAPIPEPVPRMVPVAPAAEAPAEAAPAEGEPDVPAVDVPRALLMPGLSLLVCGVLSAIFQLVALRAHLTLGPEGVLGLVGDMLSPDMVRTVKETMSPERFFGYVIAGDVVSLLVALGIALGAVQILRVGRYWLALLGSVLAVVNLASLAGMPCCFFTGPLGMWSVMVLRLPEVRAAFAAPADPEAGPPADAPPPS